MPTYEYRCDCGREQEHFRMMENRRDPAPCPCGRNADLVPSIPGLTGLEQERGYYCQGLGKWIESKHHAREEAKIMGVQPKW